MIIDSSALVAILLGEPEADALADALAHADAPRISAANWFEAMIVITTRLGDAGTQALEELLEAAAIRIEATDQAQAAAAFAAWQRYGKGRHSAGLNFGDCFAYALARQSGEALLFKGEDFGRTDIVPALSAAH